MTFFLSVEWDISPKVCQIILETPCNQYLTNEKLSFSSKCMTRNYFCCCLAVIILCGFPGITAHNIRTGSNKKLWYNNASKDIWMMNDRNEGNQWNLKEHLFGRKGVQEQWRDYFVRLWVKLEDSRALGGARNTCGSASQKRYVLHSVDRWRHRAVAWVFSCQQNEEYWGNIKILSWQTCVMKELRIVKQC